MACHLAQGRECPRGKPDCPFSHEDVDVAARKKFLNKIGKGAPKSKAKAGPKNKAKPADGTQASSLASPVQSSPVLPAAEPLPQVPEAVRAPTSSGLH